ncbi:MAG: hydroxymethylpyrimidine/phosphomethylpyrimidine kinase [bacterium]
MKNKNLRLCCALTIGGSDPSGGAGIQADIKTFTRLKVYGLSVITCLTIQNTRGIRDSYPVPPEIVTAQLENILDDIPIASAKIGMLATGRIAKAVATVIKKYPIKNLIIDPIILSKNNYPMLDEMAIDVLLNELLPLACLITPNLPEALVLTNIITNNNETSSLKIGPKEDRNLFSSLTFNDEERRTKNQKQVFTDEDMKNMAKIIYFQGANTVLLKGGHLNSETIADLFYNGKNFTFFKKQRIKGKEPHGTGCALSSAITANLAKEKSLTESICLAETFITKVIANSFSLGKGYEQLG